MGLGLKSGLLERLSDHQYAKVMSARLDYRRASRVLTYNRDDCHFIYDDGEQKIAFARRVRFQRYKNGIQNKLDRLAKRYMLTEVDLSLGDVVIDCGANIGEIGLWLKQFNVNYFGFEPEPIEAHCCAINIGSDGEVLNKALWKTNEQLTFYSKPGGADSSAIAPPSYTDVLTVDAVTLDDFAAENSLDKIKLFKLEAEGAEPEILEGCKKVLPNIEYIAADCGPERGVDEQPTFVPVNNMLTEAGFTIVATRSIGVFLYHNSRFA